MINSISSFFRGYQFFLLHHRLLLPPSDSRRYFYFHFTVSVHVTFLLNLLLFPCFWDFLILFTSFFSRLKFVLGLYHRGPLYSILRRFLYIDFCLNYWLWCVCSSFHCLLFVTDDDVFPTTFIFIGNSYSLLSFRSCKESLIKTTNIRVHMSTVQLRQQKNSLSPALRKKHQKAGKEVKKRNRWPRQPSSVLLDWLHFYSISCVLLCSTFFFLPVLPFFLVLLRSLSSNLDYTFLLPAISVLCSAIAYYFRFRITHVVLVYFYFASVSFLVNLLLCSWFFRVFMFTSFLSRFTSFDFFLQRLPSSWFSRVRSLVFIVFFSWRISSVFYFMVFSLSSVITRCARPVHGMLVIPKTPAPPKLALLTSN